MSVVARRVVVVAFTLGARAAAQDLPCRLDGRLLPAARAAMETPPPTAATVRALTEGASMRAPEVLTWRAEGGDAALRRARLHAWIRSRAPDGVPRCAVVHGDAQTAAALVPRLAELQITADPARWCVALPAEASTPQLVVAPDDGPIRRVDLGADGCAPAPVLTAATLQVTLVRAGDPQVWARWRVGPPAAWEHPAVADDLGVRRAVNDLRARARRGALRPDPLAAMLAGRRAQTLAASRRVAHVIDDEGPLNVWRDAQVQAGFVAEVVARGPTLRDALGALLTSPAHRERLEEAGARVIGVGAARADGQVYLVVLLTDGAAARRRALRLRPWARC
ncbi:MAG: hypothetical protein U0325_21555 [Polyangiales bacterium]